MGEKYKSENLKMIGMEKYTTIMTECEIRFSVSYTIKLQYVRWLSLVGMGEKERDCVSV